MRSMAPIPVRVGNESFPSRTAAQEAVRALIARNKLDEPLQGSDLAFAEALLQAHPQAEYKRRHGSSAIVVTQAEGYTTKCLAVVGLGGEKEEFSFRVALGLQPCVPLLGAAARTAVDETISSFRRSAFAAGLVTCPVLCVPVPPRDAHVDHGPPWPFDKIVRAFVAEHGEPSITHQGNRDMFADQADAAVFKAWHDERAQLRIVHRIANLSNLRRGDGKGWEALDRKP